MYLQCHVHVVRNGDCVNFYDSIDLVSFKNYTKIQHYIFLSANPTRVSLDYEGTCKPHVKSASGQVIQTTTDYL